jgi:hypothetical protein
MKIVSQLAMIRRVRLTGQDWSSSLALAVVVGLLVVAYYGWSVRTPEHLVAAILLSGASLLVGLFLGFLFGIPRSLQSELPPPLPERAETPEAKQEAQRLRFQYRANTNLEQISDWLTKILVGVGLTQLVALPELSTRLGEYFGAAIGPSMAAQRIAVAIIFFFSLSGFLLGYLWTRLFLGGELARADLNAVTEQVREIAVAQEEQPHLDAAALSLANQYLQAADIAKLSPEELKIAIQRASPPVKVQVFYQARELRSRSWQQNVDKPRIDRTIPVFEALIASDKDNLFHQNYGQLGFAFKDKRKPDFARAEKELTTAIDIRGPASEAGWEIYEINRAICRIRQDPHFVEGRPASPEFRNGILSDLKIAIKAFPDLFGEPEIVEWLKVNNITDELAGPDESHLGRKD